MLKRDLPEHNYTLVKSPNDSTKLVGFIPKSALTKKSKSKLRSIIFHTNSRSITVYDVRSKQAEENRTLNGDEETAAIFKSFFNSNLEASQGFTGYVKYKENQKVEYSGFQSSKTVDYKDRIVNWTKSDPHIGIFESDSDLEKSSNAIIVDPELSRYITPGLPFANCDYGITHIISPSAITTLVYVGYK